jgi:hypothetical protein
MGLFFDDDEEDQASGAADANTSGDHALALALAQQSASDTAGDHALALALAQDSAAAPRDGSDQLQPTDTFDVRQDGPFPNIHDLFMYYNNLYFEVR